MSLWATKSIAALQSDTAASGGHALERTLGAGNLVALGIGAFIAAGLSC